PFATAVPPVQAPAWQVSPVLQPVLQAVPLAAFRHWQASPTPSPLLSTWLTLFVSGPLSRQSLRVSPSVALLSRRNPPARLFPTMRGVNLVRSTSAAATAVATTCTSATPRVRAGALECCTLRR